MQILNDKIKNDAWYKEWRLVGAYVFFMICFHDFVLAPNLTYLYSYLFKTTYTPWVPLTTQGGGLFFVAYGGILGISAWGKFSENKEMMRFTQDQSSDSDNNDNSNTPTTTTTTTTK
jgi:hypothetical protein